MSSERDRARTSQSTSASSHAQDTSPSHGSSSAALDGPNRAGSSKEPILGFKGLQLSASSVMKGAAPLTLSSAIGARDHGQVWISHDDTVSRAATAIAINSVRSPFSVVSQASAVIAPGQAVPIDVAFNPTAAGDVTDELAVVPELGPHVVFPLRGKVAPTVGQPAKHPVPPAQAERPAPPEKTPRLLLPSSFDLGEQIVGSEHLLSVGEASVDTATPQHGDVTLRVRPGIEGAEAFKPPESSGWFGLATSGGASFYVTEVPLRVRFSPAREGRYRANAIIIVRWQNGSTTEQEITLSASARNLDSAPPQPDPDSGPTSTRAPLVVKDKHKHKTPTVEQAIQFGTAAQEASDAVAGLAKSQDDGLILAEGEIKGGTRVTPRPSLVAGLANLAITMAVGGVAQVVGKLIARNLVGWASNADSKEALASVRASQLVDGLGAAIKDGLKSTTKEAISVLANEEAKGTTSKDSRRRESKDPVVRFFARQRNLLTALQADNRKLVTDERKRLMPIFGARPEMVLSFLERLAALFKDTAIEATAIQARATVVQWVTGVAQETLGTQEVSRGGESVGRATKISPQYSVARKGLLEIHAQYDGSDVEMNVERVKFERAELRGVSDAAAARLREVELLSLGIPIRIVVRMRSSTMFISRDEVGRVQVENSKNAHQVDSTSIQGNRDGERICAHLNSKSLEDWGVAVATDIHNSSEMEAR